MKRTRESMLHTFLVAVVCLFSLIARGQGLGPPATSKGATALANQYLSAIERTISLPSTDGDREDVIFIGQSLNPPRGWRIIAVADQKKTQLVWDSFSLRDAYLNVTGLSYISAESDSHHGYIIKLRGCVPHQCADGKIGFALYVSQSHRTYLAHVSAQEDDSYRVTYDPKSGIPDTYREKLDQMMCSDNGISRPSSLPIKCSSR